MNEQGALPQNPKYHNLLSIGKHKIPQALTAFALMLDQKAELPPKRTSPEEFFKLIMLRASIEAVRELSGKGVSIIGLTAEEMSALIVEELRDNADTYLATLNTNLEEVNSLPGTEFKPVEEAEFKSMIDQVTVDSLEEIRRLEVNLANIFTEPNVAFDVGEPVPGLKIEDSSYGNDDVLDIHFSSVVLAKVGLRAVTEITMSLITNPGKGKADFYAITTLADAEWANATVKELHKHARRIFESIAKEAYYLEGLDIQVGEKTDPFNNRKTVLRIAAPATDLREEPYFVELVAQVQSGTAVFDILASEVDLGKGLHSLDEPVPEQLIRRYYDLIYILSLFDNELENYSSSLLTCG